MSFLRETQVAIVGGGFTGLAMAYELCKRGVAVTILEAESHIGGLAAGFDVGGANVERFYHHWFTSDVDITQLVNELGLYDRIVFNPTDTSVYYAHNFFRLSTPFDLLKFQALTPLDRVRLGLLIIRVRLLGDWMSLEGKTAHEWLRQLGGERVYRVVWQPLLTGKFGPYAEQISAAWFWSRINLRGGSRDKTGKEMLAYFKGGFVALADELVGRIRKLNGRIELDARVSKIDPFSGAWSIATSQGVLLSDRVVVTTALPLIADMVREWASDDYVRNLREFHYLANVCLVLELDRPLSESYWLNVNDPNFPFVGIIEHTNFHSADVYGGRHIVYVSKYLPHTDPLYCMDADDLLNYALPFLQTMFPAMRRSWIHAHSLWRARWAQPIVGLHYSKRVPSADGPKDGFHICSMAQIYPQDRGTNYAVREGRRLGVRLARLTGGRAALM